MQRNSSSHESTQQLEDELGYVHMSTEHREFVRLCTMSTVPQLCSDDAAVLYKNHLQDPKFTVSYRDEDIAAAAALWALSKSLSELQN